MSYIIQLLKENEQAVCDLYELFAKKFPIYRVFWKSIADDERLHVQFLEYTERKKIKVNEGILNIKQVKNTIDHVRGLHERIMSGEELTILQAVKEAINVENSIVEMNFFKPFELNTGYVHQSIEKIKEETKGHYKKLKMLKDSLS